jgi:hypothetical protein
MIEYKYDEENLLRELKEYMDATYGQHYSQNKFHQHPTLYLNSITYYNIQ